MKNITLTQEGTPFAVSFTLAGSTGLSAYQQWLIEGNTGTWDDFYESLRGGVTEEVQVLHDEAVAAAGRASTSETNAASSATTAETAASGASTSADSASTSASNALSSANSAATSEANALDYKNAAAGSASNALSSENKAEQWAESPVDTEVEAGKKSALHHATKAAASETAAEGYASSAAGSENSAATSASNALDSKNSAATSAGSASTSASDAATSASNASTSESNALGYRNASQAWAEGTEPGGVGTKSSKGWADDSSASAAAAENYSVLAANNSRLSIGTVTTGPEGTEASATIAGEPGSQTLSVTIPRGNTGEIGLNGISAYEVALGSGFVGTEAEWLASLAGEQGEQGAGIESIVRTAGNGSSGTIDTYTITYADATTSTFTVYNGADGAGAGDMLKSTYDTNGSGVVDNAELVNGLSVETAVPLNAVFTDTTYESVSELTNDAGYLTSETVTSLSLTTNILTYVDENGTPHDIDLSLYLDDTNLARLTSGTLDGPTGIATFTRDDASTFTVDFSALLDDTQVTVEDSLTSTSTVNALSANQGRILGESLPSSIDDLIDVDTSTATPATGDALIWDGSAWVPGGVASHVAPIEQPTITSPLDGVAGVILGPTITLSSYYSLYGKPQQALRVQISTVSDFATTVVDETLGAVSEYTPSSNLATSTGYYVRGMYQDDDGVWSAWTPTINFTTLDIYTEAPYITSPADNALYQSLTPSISTSAFNTGNGSDTHESTDWQVASTSNFSSIVWQSSADISNLTSVTVPGGNLAAGETYYLRVRYTGADFGTSAWSSVITISTDEVAQPSITSPLDGAVDVVPNATLSASAFSVGTTDTHLESDWEVASDNLFATVVFSSYADTSNLTSIDVSGLSITTQYYARVRYTGQSFGDSAWSAPISFTTADIYIEQPTITSPTSGATDIGETPTFTTDAFSCINGTDTHAETSWYLYRTSDETLVWSSVGDTSNLESITIPAGNHATDTEYRLEAIHTGTTYGDSTKGAVTYTTAASFFDWGPGDDYDAMVAAGNYDDTTDTGYMGFVASADLTDGPTLASDIGLSAGTAFNNDAGWLKFYVGPAADCNKDAVAKIVFIARQTIRHTLSWDSIYLAGAVYGTGDNGTAAASKGTTATQDAQVTYGSTTYKVRLLTGAATDPAAEAYNNQSCADDAGGGTEWNDLLYRVHTAVPTCTDATIGMEGGSETTRHGGPQDGANWASYTSAELHVLYTDAGDGTYCWCQEQGNNTVRRVTRGYSGVADFGTYTADYTSAPFGFRPCLEVVQA
jgi:hypothetical protein